jgi:Rnl2 family RNA ligase
VRAHLNDFNGKEMFMEFLVNKDLKKVKHECIFEMPHMFESDAEKAVCKICGKSILDGVVLPEPEPEKPIEFIKYRSIHRTDLKNCIDKIYQDGLSVGTWVATNKLHGTNFSLMASADKVLPCTRERILPPEENHFGYKAMMPYLHRAIINMQSYFGKNIQVYFELFGGSYNHPNVPVNKNFSSCGKGVFYCPWIDVRVIDINVDGKYLDWDEMCVIAKEHGLTPVKEMKRGTFEEMIGLDPEFEDPTYLDYQLPKIEDNFSEGYVIRPLEDKYFRNGRRLILKNKSLKFKEKNKAPKTERNTVEASWTPEFQEAYDNLSACVTENRLNNIFSHGETFTSKDFPKLQSIMLRDILEEEKDSDYFTKLDKSQRKSLVKIINKDIAELIRPFFVANLNEEF